MPGCKIGTGLLYETINPLVAEGESYEREAIPERSCRRGLILLTRSTPGTLYLV